MRTGILTFHFGRNYGALLQAYGLRKAITSLGHEAVVLHYIPDYYTGCMTPEENKWIRLGWRTYGPRLAIERRWRTFRFNRFKKRDLCLTKRCHNKWDLIQRAAELDAVVVGSDQVWNLNYLKSEDLCYFLDFPLQNRLRCISYAACCGRREQPPAYLVNVPKLLAKFHSIGVRNDVTAHFVNSQTEQRTTIVADPTMLVDYDTLEDGYVPESKYILTYTLGKQSLSDCAKVVSDLKKKLRLPVWAISDGNAQWKDIPFPGADRNWFGISPGRFLSLIKHAACVVTDSFHGTIFSVKYQRPFLTLDNSGWRNMRMLDLANRYGLDHRIKNLYNSIDHRLLLRADDLTSVHERFDLHKVESYEFLKKALSGN